MSRTRLGQNFLIDPDWQQKIVSYFNPMGDFGEIGPGRGALTEILEKKYTRFVVFEKDEQLAELHTSKKSHYHVITGDFLDWNFSLLGESVRDFSLIGNLPYESGTAMVQKICENSSAISHFVFLLQKEVVERMTAKPQTRDFAYLTVLLQGQYKVEALDVIPPAAFSPPPKVDSQIIRASLRQEGRHTWDVDYKKFLQGAFQNKRKTLRNVLRSRYQPELLNRVYEKFNFLATVRAEEIPVDLWPQIYLEFAGER